MSGRFAGLSRSSVGAEPGFVLGDDGLFRAPLLSRVPWVWHGFGTRHAAVTVPIVTLRQIHSAVIHNAAGLRDREQDGDGLVANEQGCRIGVRTADCVPIIAVDPVQRAVAAVHAGWRGTAAGIAGELLTHMAADFDTRAEDLLVGIGPAIGPCCYETSAAIASEFRRWDAVTGERNLNLSMANRRQLEAAGVPSRNIAEAQLCTRCNPEWFFSYRREPDEAGRMISAVERIA